MKIVNQSLWILLIPSLIGLSSVGSADDNPIVNPALTLNLAPAPGPNLASRPSNPTCVAAAKPSIGSVTFNNAFPFLGPGTGGARLTGLRQLVGNDNFWYVLSHQGQILRFEANPDVRTTTTALDIRDRVSTNIERGLLGFAFSPNFSSDGAVYVSYTTSTHSRISRFVSPDGGVTFPSTPADEKIIFEHIQQSNIHNSGDLHFGPDGYLYLSLGDDGSRNLAQDLTDMRGSILRIDPNRDDNLPTDSEITVREYAIPPDNPFAGDNSARPEIYAYGFRNPWRFTIDGPTGEVWVGDVGEADREEIDLLTPGGNYGWPHKEGTLCFQSSPCNNSDWIDPVVEYDHSEGGLSVIAGHVYRGSAVPELIGKMIFSDWGTGTAWAVNFDAETGKASRVEIGNVGRFKAVSWGQSNSGELYPVTNGFPKMAPAGGGTDQTFPQKLSETGCVVDTDATQKVAGLIPYNVNMPLWSDNATKQRWLAIPDNTYITIDSNGHWDLPIGSVLVKDFVADNQLAETRLLMRHTDGDWAGYAYKWNEAGTDADLVLAGSTYNTGLRDWVIPSAAQCIQCHIPAAGQTLGLQTAQLNRLYNYAEAGDVNQITAFHSLNLLSLDPGDPTALDKLSQFSDGSDDEKHARDYLHVQCAHCHQPGSVNTVIDLRWHTTFGNTGLCNKPPLSGNLGVDGATLLTPGSASLSVLSLRMHARGNSYQMPKLGTQLKDIEAMTIIDRWINTLQDCP